jgi:hypothetical protein
MKNNHPILMLFLAPLMGLALVIFLPILGWVYVGGHLIRLLWRKLSQKNAAYLTPPGA